MFMLVSQDVRFIRDKLFRVFVNHMSSLDIILFGIYEKKISDLKLTNSQGWKITENNCVPLKLYLCHNKLYSL